LVLILTSALILSVSLSLVFHNAAREQEFAAVREHAVLMADLFGGGVTGDFHFSDYYNITTEITRITIIAPDGAVLLDSRAAAGLMENHAERPEIIQALQTGTGESLRYSSTLWKEMYYYAVRLDDGNVLRVSRAVGGLADVFAVILPIVAALTILVPAIASLVARRLTERIIAPLENIDLDSDNSEIYEELKPYAAKIERQRQDIKDKLVALSQRAETIEAITGNMKEGLILIDKHATVLMANNSARELIGENIEEKNIMHIYRDDDFHNAVRQSLTGENAEMRVERGDRVFNAFFSPVNSGASANGAVILFHDVTERYRAEKQRREFSANVSHELKTPLTTISALSEMIDNGMVKDDDVKSFAARISEQAGRLLLLIDDIIRLSEFDEGVVKKEDTVFDVWDLAETVVGSFQGNAANVEIKLTGERLVIAANHRMIDELLYNLIDNGIKYNRDGGCVTIKLSRKEAGLLRISVSDTGIGIPPQHRERVFERFYRVDMSRSKKTGGTGLGLSIVKHIAEYYNGSVELQSTEEGTTVTCFLSCITGTL